MWLASYFGLKLNNDAVENDVVKTLDNDLNRDLNFASCF